MSSPSGDDPSRFRPLRPLPSHLLRQAEQIFNFDPGAATFEPTTTTAATAPGGTTATTVSQGQAAPQPHPGLAATAPPQAPAPVSATAGEGFGQLPDGGDISDPYAWPSARELARKLLDPPRQAYSVHHKRTGFIQIQLRWVLRTVGEPHFRNDKTLSRSVLKENSKLRTHGLEAGMPEGYWRWLCGNREEGASGLERSEYWIPEAEFYLRPNQIPSLRRNPQQATSQYGAQPAQVPASEGYYGMAAQYQQAPHYQQPPQSPSAPFQYPPYYYYQG